MTDTDTNTNTGTDTDTTTDIAAVVDAYMASWNEADDAKRAGLVARAWTADGRYVDPVQEAKGHTELAALAPNVQQHYPGARFTRPSGIDVHHDLVRFAWDLTNPDGSVVVGGIDIGLIGPDGKLLGIAGFFGDVPEA